MLRVGVVGVRGYTGEELVGILLKHPSVRLTYLAATLKKPESYGDLFARFKARTNLVCEKFSVEKAAGECDILFLALPHTVSMDVVPRLARRKKKIIDLSADYRLKDAALYEVWYHKPHKDKAGLGKFVYGLPELYREKIRKADFVANPGCYPTAAILGILPALISGLADEEGIIIDAKSGVTGAGRKVTPDYLYAEVNENFKGYKFNVHQHAPEINQELSCIASGRISVVFCPHLLPLNRGIFETIYIRLKKQTTGDQIERIYKKFYKTEFFVRVKGLGEMPELKDVVGTNFCDIGLVHDEKRKLLIVVSVIDNLLKGASGQAVQNLNIMCGFDEKSALL